MIIRSALKLSNSSTQIIEIAKLYLQHTSYPGLSFTASLFFKQANMLSGSYSLLPLIAIEELILQFIDAISSCLHTISLRGSLPPYINHLISLFPITTTSSDSQNIKNERIQNLLSKKALRRLVTSSEVDCLIEHLELEAQDHKTMSGLLSFVEEVEESEEVRNVRSL